MARMRPAALLQRSKLKVAARRIPIDLCTCLLLGIALLVLVLLATLFFRRGASSAGQEALQESRNASEAATQLGRKGLNAGGSNPDALPRVMLKTSMGDIVLELFAKDCPNTVDNFLSLAKKKYYNGVKFHRVIKNFMIQGGDPTGTGAGGESKWGHPFKDELGGKLKHEAFTLSMANSGPDTNGSQFFITTVPTPHLDGKHTAFGTVIKGKEVVKAIESVETGVGDRPVKDVTILDTILDPDLCC